MFNYSANNLILLSSNLSEKYNFFILKDRDTNRCYKIFDFFKKASFEPNKAYCISGKVNSADRIYLVLESVKEDKKHVVK